MADRKDNGMNSVTETNKVNDNDTVVDPNGVVVEFN